MKTLDFKINQGIFVFCKCDVDQVPDDIEPLMQFKEEEGLTIIIEYSQLKPEMEMEVSTQKFAWITCTTTTKLSETGITRKISFVLDALGIPCNIVAAFHHDHIFVPYTMRLKALSALTSLGKG